MEVILGILWMETLDEYTQSFKRMDFTFVVDGKKVVLRKMANEGSKEVFAHRMEAIFWCLGRTLFCLGGTHKRTMDTSPG